MKNPYENLISENFKEYERGLYDRYPTFLIPENQIIPGYDRLVENIKEEDLLGKRVFVIDGYNGCLLYTSPSPRDNTTSRMPSSA